MIRDIDYNHPPERTAAKTANPSAKDRCIQRIDQARGVIALAVYALAWDHGFYSALAASALDLANDELQRLREEIDAQEVPDEGATKP